jgi:hypothetical protein
MGYIYAGVQVSIVDGNASRLLEKGDFKAFLAIPAVNGEVFIYKGLWSCWGLDDGVREVRGLTRGT